MYKRWAIASSAVAIISASAIYSSWLYVRSAARETFENDITKVKQSFYESVKAAESAEQALKSLAEAIDDGDQSRFGKFSSDLMSKLPFVVGTAYYRHVDNAARKRYETELKSRHLGETIIETSTSSADQAMTIAKQRSEYFAVDAVDSAAKDQAYFGWDALSDVSRATAINAAVTQKQAMATGTFLLDSGSVAFEILAPVYRSSGELRGIVGATVDLTKMLGEERWREGVTVIMTTVLSGESAAKDIYRSLDKEPVRFAEMGSLFSNIEVERFGQKLGLKFEKVLFPGRVNLSIVGMAAGGAFLLAVLAFYLLVTYDRLQISLGSLAEANATLEEKVASRTKELALAHAEIKEILDNLDEVVFAVDPNRIIGPIYSPASKRLLERDDFFGLDLSTVLFKDLDRHDENASRHLFALQMLASLDEFQWSLSSGDLLKVSHFQLKDGSRRTFSLRYSPIFVADALRKMVVVASDVTEIMALKESLAAREKEASTKDAVLSELAAADKSQLRGFFSELDERMNQVETFAKSPKISDVLPALRSLHTLKGGSRSVGLKTLAKRIHEIEDGLEPLRALVSGANSDSDSTFAGIVENSNLKDGCEFYLEYRRVFKELFDSSMSNAQPQLTGRILPFLKVQRNQRSDLVKWYEDASKQGITSISELVGGFSKSIAELATQLSKKVDLQIPEWDLFFDPALKGPFNEALTHALRNAVDHGIELPETRSARGKKENGRIWLERETVGQNMVLTVVDDGGGIDVQRVYKIAFEKGLVKKSYAELKQEEIFDLLFLPGFSTKTEISDVSGRGIGLDAVRSGFAAFGVTCRITATSGSGSRFEFLIPLKWIRFLANENAELSALAS